jgi:hypothetical protein
VLLLYTKGDRTPDNASLLIGLSMLTAVHAFMEYSLTDQL